MDQSHHEASPLPFFHVIERLKRLKRAGWVRRGIASPESVADHMYRMGLMCLAFLGRSDLDIAKMVNMALIHDIGEACTGDITPADKVTKEEKYLRERLAVMFLSCLMHSVNPTASKPIMELWLEFEDCKSRETMLVEDFDRYECLLQAVEYERSQGISLEDLLTEADEIRTPEAKAWAGHVLRGRKETWGKKIDRAVVIFVLGGPGVGKGTQCAMLARELNFQHISVGDLLGSLSIIPAQLTVGQSQERMRQLSNEGNTRFLIDVFPRSMEQILEFEERVNRRCSTVFLDCHEDAMVERLMDRASISGRVDDNPDSIRKRIETYRRENEPILAHLSQTGLVRTINCNTSVDDVYKLTNAAVDGITNETEKHQA